MSRRIPRARLLPTPIAAIDTNVFVEIHSCHDLTQQTNQLGLVLTPQGIERQKIFRFRTQRAREALLLAMHLHSIRASTYTLRSESVSMLEKFSPPDIADINTAFTIVFIYFVGDYLLPGWQNQTQFRPDGFKKDAADLALIKYAKEKSIPIITHEGHTPDGVVETNTKNNMRARCKKEGVNVFTPREFYEKAGFDEETAIENFLNAYADAVPHYLDRQGRKGNREKVLKDVFGMYRLILRGEVGYQDDRIQVSNW